MNIPAIAYSAKNINRNRKSVHGISKIKVGII